MTKTINSVESAPSSANIEDKLADVKSLLMQTRVRCSELAKDRNRHQTAAIEALQRYDSLRRASAAVMGGLLAVIAGQAAILWLR